jgi:hypothetical protein
MTQKNIDAKLFVRLNPQLEGKTDATFPEDFPGLDSPDDAKLQFADDGWINVVTGRSFEDIEEFESVIPLLVQDFERDIAATNERAFIEAKEAVERLANITNARYLRACMADDNDKDSAKIKQIGSLSSCAQTALNALCAWEEQTTLPQSSAS